ncbi:COPII coat Sec23p-Sfb3p heterodimer component [Blyttiomyces sp. JEL0837]|nr:COPII coat Sec23p-Sfb3p heterodimer component [Blyttiomyces sp. JEL0837]
MNQPGPPDAHHQGLIPSSPAFRPNHPRPAGPPNPTAAPQGFVPGVQGPRPGGFQPMMPQSDGPKAHPLGQAPPSSTGMNPAAKVNQPPPNAGPNQFRPPMAPGMVQQQSGGGQPPPQMMGQPPSFNPNSNAGPLGPQFGGPNASVPPNPNPQMNALPPAAGSATSPVPQQPPINEMGMMNISGPGPRASTSNRARRVYANASGDVNSPVDNGMQSPGANMPPNFRPPGAPGFGGMQGQQQPPSQFPPPQGLQGQAPPQQHQPPFMPHQPPSFGAQPPSFGAQPPTFGAQPPSFGNQPPMQGQPGHGPGMQMHQGMQPGKQQPMNGRPAAPAQQQRSRIDPNQIPSPLIVQETDQQNYETTPYSTFSRNMPPLASTHFRAVDEGNCNPRFMRLTAYQFPCTEELLTSSMLPLGAVIQPLADLEHDEAPLSVVDCGPNGPIRCRRCRAYINPYFQFTDGGRKFICNLCGCDTEVPPDYFCHLDMSGRRMDLDRRPELMQGAVEFTATKEYFSRPPKPPGYVFAIDVSHNSIASGMLARAALAIKELLYGGKGLPPKSKVGIITFDKSIHFYNLKAGLEQASMLVVPDINDVFVPLNEGFLVNPIESRPVIENLLGSLPTIFANNVVREPMLGAAVQASLMAMEVFLQKDNGGRLYLFQTCLPMSGPGALKMREDIKLLGTDKEKTLYEPQEYFWRKMAQDCSQAGVCVDLFLFPNAYIDIATIGTLASLTGGDTYCYTNFDQAKDGFRFGEDLKTSVQRTFGFEAVMRIRTSNGLRVTDYFGNFYMKNATDIELAGIDSQKAMAVAFKHESKLDEKSESAIQVALLYTNMDGERRIRVLNISVPNTTSLGNVFRYAEMDTTVNYLAKASVSQAVSTPLKTVREQLTDRCVKILTAYRKHCASSTSPGQLILPEAFKLYPLYTLSLLKSRAFKGGPEMSTDHRILCMRLLRNMNMRESTAYFYPRMVPVHVMPPQAGTPNARGRIQFPASIRVSIERLEADGIYLLENGFQVFCWVGRKASSENLAQLFGVENVEAVDISMRMFPAIQSPLSERVRNIVQQMFADRQRVMALQIVRHEIDTFLEVEFNNLMVEDQNHDGMNYVDYLCFVHR